MGDGRLGNVHRREASRADEDRPRLRGGGRVDSSASRTTEANDGGAHQSSLHRPIPGILHSLNRIACGSRGKSGRTPGGRNVTYEPGTITPAHTWVELNKDT